MVGIGKLVELKTCFDNSWRVGWSEDNDEPIGCAGKFLKT